MTSLDELKRTLEQGAGHAPDPAGLVEQAQAGAVRLRRRNRIRGAVVTVVAVAAAMAVPSVVRSYSAEPPPPNPAGPMTYYREPYEHTLELASNPTYFTMLHGTQGKTQFLVARSLKNSSRDGGGTVAVHDPGTFDPTRLRRGEQVTVQGHPAHYVDKLEEPAPTDSPSTGPGGTPYRIGPAVGWQDPSGAWVIVYESVDRASLLRLAQTVRLTAPHTAKAPVRFGWVPDDLPVSYTESRDVAEHGVEAQIGLGNPDEAPDQSSPFFMMPYSTPLSVIALPMEGIMTMWGEDYAKRPMKLIAGHKTWYIEGNGGPFNNKDGSQLLIDAGSCAVTLTVKDRTAIPYAALDRMVQNMIIGTCDDTSDWQPIVGP
ncbi:hypothetical protein [Paractinoplanes lichenicola]|uniref:Uncharacterized protein n=1 Tax=Paractinoplanes lichenicola TaxID=2802976 RepID=A0ABS1VFU3_9ACTN|nr:hypothetical protein [Actinoplanes lichenicola]MBL7253490.1 hypothetical protein [Actinoplanes lichenicola]